VLNAALRKAVVGSIMILAVLTVLWLFGLLRGTAVVY
jgi:hypothetical protein